MRKYTLNRPGKLNALDESMLDLLRPKIEVRELYGYRSCLPGANATSRSGINQNFVGPSSAAASVVGFALVVMSSVGVIDSRRRPMY